MAESTSNPENFHSQNRTSRLFHGLRQHLKDTTGRNKLRETEAVAKKEALVKQQAVPADAPKAKEDFSLNISKV